MCILFFLLIIIGAISTSETIVYPKPNNEDKNYWHNYNMQYVKNILKSNSDKKDTKAKNVILFVGDGMSLGTISAGRALKGQLAGNSGEETDLVFESFSHVGLSKTYNTNSQVPDSAGDLWFYMNYFFKLSNKIYRNSNCTLFWNKNCN